MKKISMIIACLMLFNAGYAAAETQEITLIPDNTTPAVGDSFSVAVQYDCTDSTLPALGIRIHFDSEKLSYTDSHNLFETGKLVGPEIQDDVENRDGDASTDKLILLGYQDIGGEWPGRSLPSDLAEFSFTAETEGGTAIRVTKVTGTAGFDFQAEDAEIVVTVASMARKKAIIVAGSKHYPDDTLWQFTEKCTNYAYKALIHQKYTPGNIMYLSPNPTMDADADGTDDVDKDATKENLEEAVTVWARDAEDVLIFMTDHGGKGTFHMNRYQILSAKDELDRWLDDLQGTMTGRVILIYDACLSGSFVSRLTPPPGKERIVITSASAEEPAIFLIDGNLSFSFQFWASVFYEPNLLSAFYIARDMMTDEQTAWLDADGNGIGYDDGNMDIPKPDQIAADDVFIGKAVTGSRPPEITDVSADSPFPDGETSAAIRVRAEDIIALNSISRVWAVILRPDYQRPEADTPVMMLPNVELRDSGDGVYKGTYDGYDVNGTYRISVYAEDSEEMYSPPVQTEVVQNGMPETKGDIDGDEKLTLKDAVTALRLAVGEPLKIPVSPADADVDGDKRIGVAEVVYVLQSVADLR